MAMEEKYLGSLSVHEFARIAKTLDIRIVKKVYAALSHNVINEVIISSGGNRKKLEKEVNRQLAAMMANGSISLFEHGLKPRKSLWFEKLKNWVPAAFFERTLS